MSADDPVTIPAPNAGQAATTLGPSPTDHQTPVTKQPAGDVPDTVTIAQVGMPNILCGSGLLDIPGYEVRGEIARGGMGMILAARDLTLGRDVAIKVLIPGHSSADAARRFINESKITARLPHPTIPPVYQLGTLADGSPFLAMKLIRGRTLADELKSAQRVSELPRLVQVFEQISQAVGFAHSQDIIHRDLKPANVMVGAFGEVQVMDWGLAKVMAAPDGDQGGGISDPIDDQLSGMTRTGSVMGTPAYMAPEQARGESVGPPADVFALGGILCDVLTGRPPFAGTTVRDTLQLAANGNVSIAFTRLDDCGADPELVSLCKRCLSPKAQDRPANGMAVSDEVAKYRAGVEERLRKAEAESAAIGARLVEQRKRRRVQLALVGAVAAILLLVGAGAWYLDRQAATKRFDDEVRQQAERERLGRNAAATESLVTQCEGLLRAGDADRASEALAQADQRIGEGGADGLTARRKRCQTELEMLKELDRIDNVGWGLVEGKIPEWEAIAPQWATAFAGYGITPGVTPPDEASRRINGSFISERLLTTLEVWFVFSGRDRNLGSILSVADPDSFREASRATNYQQAALSWAFHRRPLVSQPVWFAVAHGQDFQVDQRSQEQLLLTALGVRPNSFPLLMALGGLAGTGDRESTVRRAGWYRAALAVHPRSVVAWNNLGVTLRAAGDLPGNIAACREAIRLDPRYAPAHTNLGCVLQERGDLVEAIAACREATRLDPKSAKAYYNLGNALKESHDLHGAVAAYRNAVRLDATLAVAHANLGLTLEDLHDLDGALTALQKARSLDAGNAIMHTNLAVLYTMRRTPDKAIESAREAIRLSPRHPNAHAALGIALCHSGDVGGGGVAFAEAARLDPEKYEPLYRKLFPLAVAPPPRVAKPER
ncbi:MAG: tetratricopeptide repeat protein [Planctomycetes bacterium]|nr:tetratricopeptide repeat protein [Planctomycetota bacterium]